MEDKYHGERVLVFERKLLDELGSFQGISTDVDRYLDAILNKRNNHFHLRYLAEMDESLQQIIPYVLFKAGDEIFSYVRGKNAGESRLVGNRSIGVGGHINPGDEVLFNKKEVSADRAVYLEAVIREIKEEVIVEERYEPKIIGLIKDESNAVGRVHFGIVHVCELTGPNVRKREQQITRAQFMKINELLGVRRKELETWSELALELLIETSDDEWVEEEEN
jgi:predicted NUDIX family phosphoesterase